MTKEQERVKEIEERKAALKAEVKEGKADEARLKEIRSEAETLNAEEEEIRTKMELSKEFRNAPVAPVQQGENRADKFRAENRMSIPMFMENRSVLVSSGKLTTPTAVLTEIGELPSTISSIIDDVETIDATGTGSWKFPYKVTDAEAKDVIEGKAIGGTGATYDSVEIGPGEWGVLDEVSNQVKKMTNVAYAASVQNSAYLALRRKAKEKVTAAILASKLLETKTVAIDVNYLRTVILNFGSDESVAGGTKLYLNKNDLADIGKIRGTNEKKALYEISFDDENNGTIKEGGLSVPFSINSSLPEGTQLYGQPKSVKMLLWGDYEVTTDDGGDYFKRNMLGIRGIATAGADLTVYHGMQKITQSAPSQG